MRKLIAYISVLFVIFFMINPAQAQMSKRAIEKARFDSLRVKLLSCDTLTQLTAMSDTVYVLKYLKLLAGGSSVPLSPDTINTDTLLVRVIRPKRGLDTVFVENSTVRMDSILIDDLLLLGGTNILSIMSDSVATSADSSEVRAIVNDSLANSNTIIQKTDSSETSALIGDTVQNYTRLSVLGDSVAAIVTDSLNTKARLSILGDSVAAIVDDSLVNYTRLSILGDTINTQYLPTRMDTLFKNPGTLGYEWDSLMQYMPLGSALEFSGKDYTYTTANVTFVDSGVVNGAVNLIRASLARIDLDEAVADLQSNQTGTAMMWVNYRSNSDDEVFWFYGNSGTNNSVWLIMSLNQVKAVHKLGGTDQWNLNTQLNLTVGKWYHVALVQDGTRPYIIIDGDSVATTLNANADLTAWFNDITIDNGRLGCSNRNGAGNFSYFGGLLDEYYYFSEALTPQEIRNIMRRSDHYHNDLTMVKRSGDQTILGTKTFVDSTHIDTVLTVDRLKIDGQDIKDLISDSIQTVAGASDSSFIALHADSLTAGKLFTTDSVRLADGFVTMSEGDSSMFFHFPGQSFKFQGAGNTATFQSQSSGSEMRFSIFSADGDKTDDTGLSIFALGTPGATTNRESMRIKWDPVYSAFTLSTEENGSGILEPIAMYVNGYPMGLVIRPNGGISLADSTLTINEADSQVVINGGLTTDSLNIIGATKPNTIISFGDWVSDPDYEVGLVDTVEIVATMDTIGTGYYPIQYGQHPDTSSAVNSLDVFSPAIEIPVYYIGVDSIVFDYYTGADGDSSSVKVDIYKYNSVTGATTFQDSTTILNSTDAWSHDGTLSTFATLARFDKILIKVEVRSRGIDSRAIIGRFIIYWKEDS